MANARTRELLVHILKMLKTRGGGGISKSGKDSFGSHLIPSSVDADLKLPKEG